MNVGFSPFENVRNWNYELQGLIDFNIINDFNITTNFSRMEVLHEEIMSLSSSVICNNLKIKVNQEKYECIDKL